MLLITQMRMGLDQVMAMPVPMRENLIQEFQKSMDELQDTKSEYNQERAQAQAGRMQSRQRSSAQGAPKNVAQATLAPRHRDRMGTGQPS